MCNPHMFFDKFTLGKLRDLTSWLKFEKETRGQNCDFGCILEIRSILGWVGESLPVNFDCANEMMVVFTLRSPA
jgi:hypothetical protein